MPLEILIKSALLYVASTGDSGESVEMRYEDENIRLTQKIMAALYDVTVPTINYHIGQVLKDSELDEDSVIKETLIYSAAALTASFPRSAARKNLDLAPFLINASDGKSYPTKHDRLKMIIAVEFKVNSERAVQFRKWVNEIAASYTIKSHQKSTQGRFFVLTERTEAGKIMPR